jgi:predicted nucleotidyltransferase component of viral defense system
MKNREELLLKVMYIMSEHFKDRLVLEGGMLLRLHNSPRETQDIDYLLVSEKSKKVLAKEIEGLLSKKEELSVTNINLHSRGIFIDIESTEKPIVKGALEVNVVPKLFKSPTSVSSMVLAQQYMISSRVITTMGLSEAFAHKIAAALQRDSIRDLYDLTFFEPLCSVDLEVLRKRLSHLSIKRQKERTVSMSEAKERLLAKAEALTDKKVKKELGAWLPQESLEGMATMIHSTIVRLVQKLY